VCIDNPRVFARDGRYFTYVRSAQDCEEMLTGCGFRTESMLQKVVRENTYHEPFLASTWANFYARKVAAPPAPDVGDQAAFLTSQAYERIARDYIHFWKNRSAPDSSREAAIARTLDRLAQELNVGTPPRVLDAGCGPGDYVLAMARRGWEAIGIDISEKMVTLAREVLQREPDPIARRASYHVQDFRYLPADWTGWFDAVIAVTALHHVPEAGGTVREVLTGFTRALRPRGVLRIDVRIGGEPGYDPDLRFIQTYPSVDTLDGVFAGAGLERIAAQTWTLPPRKNALRRDVGFKYATIWLRTGR
jgi:SAM-dependent methyltransferase